MAKKKQIPVRIKEVESKIILFRGQRVMLDEDLATLYGVKTSVLNQAVKRNSERFPKDFAFRLTEKEFTALKSQIVTSKTGRGGRRKVPWAFTEHGVAMLSSVLRSPVAVSVNIEIMRAFVRIRRLMATPGELVEQITRLAETVKVHDDKIDAIIEVLKEMIAEKEQDQPGRIGFRK